MKKTLRIALGMAAVLVLCAAGVFVWSLTKSSSLRPSAANMTDVETEALWMYLQSVQPVASRE